ncbi:unnamed protein product [Gordionus sp. m RMFG-2023]|uniref:inositol monophosphatase 1-like n=1 Tax=Gordionus sp. m RMFG-2023 TaxID=3053472 RepID=UPI0030E27469
MSKDQIDEWYTFGLHLAKESGKMMLDAFHKEKTINTKQTFADLVTETDKAIEKFIFDNIRQKYKDHVCIGEESEERPPWNNSPTWIVDPIDGTTNFIHQFPNCAVSIGVSYDKKIVIGIIYNPMQNLLYTAKKGQGAFCNQKKIFSSKVTDIGKALIFTEVGSLRKENIIDKKLENYARLARASHGIRSMGSAALNLCAIASGQGDGGFEFGIHIWDIAAGVLIVTEAGGVIMDPKGGDLDLLSRKFLAAGTKELADTISSKITPIQFESD